MQRQPRRFTALDALLLLLGGILLGYLFYRTQLQFHYRWDWQAIPGYIVRHDEERGWVLNLLGQGLLSTVRLSIYGGLLAALIGTVIGIWRVADSLFLRLTSRAYVELIRNLPPLVFIFIFYFFISDQLMPLLNLEQRIADSSPEVRNLLGWLFGAPELLSNFLAGLLCLALFESAYVAEIVRAGMQAVPSGQTEAAQALGMNQQQVLRYILLPQALHKMAPALLGQFISLIKDSALISLISIQELTFSGTELAVSSGRVFEIWLTVAALYFVLCFGLARGFRFVERRWEYRHTRGGR